MIRRTSCSNPTDHAGLLENLVALSRAVADFFESRLALFARESKAALVQLLVLGACLVLALILSLLGYVFLAASAVVGVAHLVEISWLWTAFVAAGIHFVMAIVLLLAARSQMNKPVFRATLIELKKDREWSKNPNATKQPTS
jgi:uncharacterized membrane protein YqjE